MIEHIWRRNWIELQIHRHTVPLLGADTLATLVEAKPLLIVARHHLIQLLTGDGHTLASARRQRLLHHYPTCRLQHQPEPLRLVTQVQAQVLTDAHHARLIYRHTHSLASGLKSPASRKCEISLSANTIRVGPLTLTTEIDVFTAGKK